MSTTLEATIARYHEKVAANFLGDWIKKHFPLPSKEKALKVLKKHIKTEKDIDDLYKSMPKMISFLKSKKAYTDNEPSSQLFPQGFIKNLVLIVALLSVLGQILSKEKTIEKLREDKIIYLDESGNRIEKPNDKYMGEITLNSKTLKDIDPRASLEEMNKELIKSIKSKQMKDLRGPKIHHIYKVKYPLELKFTLDRNGKGYLSPSQLKKQKPGSKIYVHREYSSDKVEEIENRLKDMEKERERKNDKA